MTNKDINDISILFEEYQSSIPWYKKVWRKIICRLDSIVYYIDSHFFRPRGKWIKKYVEYYYWEDKISMIPSFLFGSLIELIETECLFEFTDFDYIDENFEDDEEYLKMVEHEKLAKKELLRCYKYAKSTRPKMISNHAKYQDRLFRMDKYFCKIIIDNLEYFWV